MVLVLMTLTELRTGQRVSGMPLSRDQTGVMNFGEEGPRAEVPFSLHRMKSTHSRMKSTHSRHTTQSPLADQAAAACRFSTAVSLFLLPLRALRKAVSAQPVLRSGELCPVKNFSLLSIRLCDHAFVPCHHIMWN